MTASEFLRRNDEDNKKVYKKFNDKVVSIAKQLLEDDAFTINWDYATQKLGSKDSQQPFGTLYRVDYNGEESTELYHMMQRNRLDKDVLSKNFEKSLKENKVLDLGDAEVVADSVRVNPSKQTYYIDEKPIVSIFFNLILPEQKEPEDAKEE